jgi:DNA-binding NarL/FixJ family response regulator
MPRTDGLRATREVRQHLPTAKIVIVSQNDPWVVRRQAEGVHADAYVGKDKLAQQLIPLIARLFPEVISKHVFKKAAWGAHSARYRQASRRRRSVRR